jgi:hypothetical protein
MLEIHMIRYEKYLLVFLVMCISLSVRAEDPVVEGRVLDFDGASVSHADVSPFWRANGSPRRADGTDYDLSDRDEASKFWGKIGEMQPWQSGTTTDGDGRFRLNMAGKCHFLVLDEKRQNGAVYRLGANKRLTDVEIRLGPLTTVKARVQIKGSDSNPIWTHVYVNLKSDPEFPLANTRVVSCGSETQSLEFSLPKGIYRLDVYAVSGKQPENIDLRVFPDRELVIDGNGGTVDLGILELQDDLLDREDLEVASKEAGRWRDYTQHYGEKAPRWNAVDARGIDAHTNIESFRGKWVLLEFWGLSCAPCLANHLPGMIDFYNEHAEQRDRFEIIGVCIDITGKLERIQDIDAELQPIVEKVWNGKKIPFPIVLDNTFKTWERFGIPGLGTAVLVDPRGNVAEGGFETLQRALKNGEPSDERKSR